MFSKIEKCSALIGVVLNWLIISGCVSKLSKDLKDFYKKKEKHGPNFFY